MHQLVGELYSSKGRKQYFRMTDIMETIYNRDYISIYYNYYIWIQSFDDRNSEQNIYPFSTITNKFLGCRVPGDKIDNKHQLNQLVYIDNNLFKMGGIDPFQHHIHSMKHNIFIHGHMHLVLMK